MVKKFLLLLLFLSTGIMASDNGKLSPEKLSFEEIHNLNQDDENIKADLKKEHETIFNKIAVRGMASVILQNSIKSRWIDHDSGVGSVAISQDSKYFVTGGWDQTAKIWNINTLELSATFAGHNNHVDSVAISPNGKYIVTGSDDKTAKIWDANNLKEISTLKGFRSCIRAVAISPNSKYIVIGACDSTVKVWDVDNLDAPRTLTGHTEPVTAVAISPDSKYFVTVSWDTTVRIWDVNSLTPTILNNGDPVFSVAISPDGKYIVTGSEGTAKVWDVTNLKISSELTGHEGEVQAITISPDSRYILTCVDIFEETIRIWDINNLKKSTELTGHGNSVASVAISPDYKYIVSGSRNGSVFIWDLTTWVADEFSLKQLLFIIKLYQEDFDKKAVKNESFKILYNSFNDEVKKKLRALILEGTLNQYMLPDLSLIVLGHFGEIPEFEEK